LPAGSQLRAFDHALRPLMHILDRSIDMQMKSFHGRTVSARRRALFPRGFYLPGIKDLLMGAQLPRADFQHSR
jgi:hypothetical protein